MPLIFNQFNLKKWYTENYQGLIFSSMQIHTRKIHHKAQYIAGNLMR